MNAHVSMKFKFKLTDAAFLAFGETVVSMMTNNPLFNTVQPVTDGSLKRAVDTYEAAFAAAADRSRIKVAEKREAKVALRTLLDQVARQVDVIADGNEAVILEAGFLVRAKPHRYEGEIGPVTNFVAKRTDNPNEALCKWDKTPYADMYALEYSTDQGQTWHNGTYSTAKHIRVKEIPGRRDVLLRACALGSRGRKGPWCDPVSLFVV